MVASSFDLRVRHVAEHRGRRGLAVGVHHQHPVALEREVMRQVHASRRLAHPALEVLAGHDDRLIGRGIAPRQTCRSACGMPESARACSPRVGCCQGSWPAAANRSRPRPAPASCGRDPPSRRPRTAKTAAAAACSPRAPAPARACAAGSSHCWREYRPACQSRGSQAHSSPKSDLSHTDLGWNLPEIRAELPADPLRDSQEPCQPPATWTLSSTNACSDMRRAACPERACWPN